MQHVRFLLHEPQTLRAQVLAFVEEDEAMQRVGRLQLKLRALFVEGGIQWAAELAHLRGTPGGGIFEPGALCVYPVIFILYERNSRTSFSRNSGETRSGGRRRAVVVMSGGEFWWEGGRREREWGGIVQTDLFFHKKGCGNGE